MLDIGSFAYAFSDRLKMYGDRSVIYDDIPIQDYRSNQAAALIEHIADHLFVDGYSAPTIFVSYNILKRLDLNSTSEIGLGDGGILKVSNPAYEGEIVVLPQTSKDKENYIGVLAEKRWYKQQQLDKEYRPNN